MFKIVVFYINAHFSINAKSNSGFVCVFLFLFLNTSSCGGSAAVKNLAVGTVCLIFHIVLRRQSKYSAIKIFSNIHIEYQNKYKLVIIPTKLYI